MPAVISVAPISPFDDIVAPHDRPILVLDGHSVQLVLHTANYLESSDAVQLDELSVILAPHGVVSARFGHATPLGDLRHRLEDDPDWLRLGPSAVLASIPLRPARRLYRLKRELRTMLVAIGSVQQNDDMRRISTWVAMAAGPTLIVDVYGMNFEAQPELHWRYGYPLALGAMLLLSAALFRAFRRAGWL